VHPDDAGREVDILPAQPDQFAAWTPPALTLTMSLLRRLVAVEEEQTPVYALIWTHFPLGWARADESERPPLKLVRVVSRELFGVIGCGGLPEHTVI
jgi:hypothetical protein